MFVPSDTVKTESRVASLDVFVLSTLALIALCAAIGALRVIHEANSGIKRRWDFMVGYRGFCLRK